MVRSSPFVETIKEISRFAFARITFTISFQLALFPFTPTISSPTFIPANCAGDIGSVAVHFSDVVIHGTTDSTFGRD